MKFWISTFDIHGLTIASVEVVTNIDPVTGEETQRLDAPQCAGGGVAHIEYVLDTIARLRPLQKARTT